jgi:hypothetical protein
VRTSKEIKMKVLYIGTEGRLKQAISDAAEVTGKEVEVTVVENGKLAVIKLLHQARQTNFVIIDCSLKEVKCISLVDFILKDDLIPRENVFVIGFHFSQNEIREFQDRGISFIAYTIDLKSLREYFSRLFAS